MLTVCTVGKHLSWPLLLGLAACAIFLLAGCSDHAASSATPFVDAHLDLSWNALDMQRDLTQSVADIQSREGATPWHGEGVCTVTLPALRAGDVRIVFGTIFAAPAGKSAPGCGYTDMESAYRITREQLDYYLRMERAGEISIIRSRQDLFAVLQGRKRAPGVVLLLEGAPGIRTMQDLHEFYRDGVRIVALCWGPSRFAGSNANPGPLTLEGRALLSEMQRLDITLDVSHLADEAFWQAMSHFNGPVIASHSNCRAIIDGERQLSDAQILELGRRKGMIGLVLYNRFIVPGWTSAQPRDVVSLHDLAPHARHIAGLIGVQTLGIGSDMDGGTGLLCTPRELTSSADMPVLYDILQQDGFSPAAARGIYGENWINWLKRVLP